MNSSSLGLSWRMLIDPESGAPYYWNSYTDELSWTRPRDMVCYDVM